MAKKLGLKMNPVMLLVGLIVLLAFIALYTYLIMIIWNKVLVKKFSGVKELGFWDALALAVFVSLLFGGSRTVCRCVVQA